MVTNFINKENKTMKILLLVIVVVIIAFLILYAYYGGFKSINIQTAEQGGETLIYEEIIGDYKQSGEVMNKLYYSLLESDKTETFKGFGIYYDNPKKVEKSKLRSEAGCILEEKDIEKYSSLSEKYSIKIFPKKKYITTEFPFKGKLSVIFSIMKVYPALAQEDGDPVSIGTYRKLHSKVLKKTAYYWDLKPELLSAYMP